MLNTILSRIRTLNRQRKIADFAGSLASQCVLLWSGGLFVISGSLAALAQPGAYRIPLGLIDNNDILPTIGGLAIAAWQPW